MITASNRFKVLIINNLFTSTCKGNDFFFHFRFPKDLNRKEKWIKATGRENWVPLSHNSMCSDHFNTNDIFISKKGYRYLTDTAIPSKKIVISKTDVSSHSKFVFR